MSQASERQILRSFLDYLAAKHVLAFRMQSGASVKSYGGKTRKIIFGLPGMADVLAFPHSGVDANGTWCDCIRPTWIECKTATGKQSELQKSFQAQVEAEGHRYAVVRSIEDLKEALK